MCRESKGWKRSLDLFGEGMPIFGGALRLSLLRKPLSYEARKRLGVSTVKYRCQKCGYFNRYREK